MKDIEQNSFLEGYKAGVEHTKSVYESMTRTLVKLAQLKSKDHKIDIEDLINIINSLNFKY